MKKPVYSLLLLLMLTAFSACNGNKKTATNDTATDSTEVSAPETTFSADSAFQYVSAQVAFGPRVPGTEAHTKCADWMEETLRNMGHQVLVQKTKLKVYSGQEFDIRNIITSIHPEATERILLMAHWDSRPMADHDADVSARKRPILGADDGASGVGVLMEIARQLKLHPIAADKGVDIIFFDLEDYGIPAQDESWCLGSQYWSQHPHIPGYTANFGILLDMVGSHDATFYWEGYSKAYASEAMHHIWQTAARLGYGKYFKQADGGAITDDHVPVIRNRHIPSVNILNYNPENKYGFGHHWHTHQDNLNIIDRTTLSVVGHTVLTVIQEF